MFGHQYASSPYFRNVGQLTKTNHPYCHSLRECFQHSFKQPGHKVLPQTLRYWSKPAII